MMLPDPAHYSHERPYTVGGAPEWVPNPYVDRPGSIADADAQLQTSFQDRTLPGHTSHPRDLGQYQQAVNQEHDSEYVGLAHYPKYGFYPVLEADVGSFPPGTIVRSSGTNSPYCKSSAPGSPCPEESSAAKHVTPALILDRRRTNICGVWIEGQCLGIDRQSRHTIRSPWRPPYRSLQT